LTILFLKNIRAWVWRFTGNMARVADLIRIVRLWIRRGVCVGLFRTSRIDRLKSRILDPGSRIVISWLSSRNPRWSKAWEGLSWDFLILISHPSDLSICSRSVVCRCARYLESAIRIQSSRYADIRIPCCRAHCKIGLVIRVNNHGTTESPKGVVRNWKVWFSQRKRRYLRNRRCIRMWRNASVRSTDVK
jgi:hypothetical protein